MTYGRVGGTRKQLSLSRVYERASVLNLDVVIGIHQRRGDWYNINTSTVNVYVVDVARKRVYEKESRFPGLEDVLRSLLGEFSAER